jgi:hypothetical protein
MIRVGRRKYNNNGFIDPSYPNFIPIICMTKSTEYGDLSPYALVDEKGRNMENLWQFQKCYEYVPTSRQTFSKYDPRVIWNHPHEIHIDDNGNITDEYWNWRNKGMNAPDAIRYPVGFNHRKNCLFSLKDLGNNMYLQLDYIDARKEIYLPLYTKYVKNKQKFLKLKKMLKEGKNLLIIEVDGPHQEDLQYYKDKYNVTNDFIEKDTLLATKQNLDIMLNDTKHPFGHGYCLALALLD